MEKQSKLDELQNDKGFKQLTAEEEKQIAGGGFQFHPCPPATNWCSEKKRCVSIPTGNFNVGGG